MQVHANYGPMSMASYGNFTTFWPYLEKYSADFHDRETKMIGNVYLNMKKASNSGGHPFSPQNIGLTDFWVKWSLFTLEITTNSLLRSTFLVLVERVAEKCGN